MKLLSSLQSVKKLVDVTGIEPATPCLQSVNRPIVTVCDGALSPAIRAGARLPGTS
jgi:hypothetical protein